MELAFAKAQVELKSGSVKMKEDINKKGVRTLMKNSYKSIIPSLVVLIVGVVVFLLYLNLNQNHNKNQNPTDIIDKENNVSLEGHLYKTENGYGLMGWDLTGDIDFEPYIDKRIVVVGQTGEDPYTVVVKEIVEIEDDIKAEIKETVVYGKLLEKNDSQSPTDSHYYIGSFDIRSNRNLSEYVDKEVAVLVNEVISKDMSVRHGDLVDINIPYTIQGILEVLSKEKGHYHYKLGEYDVHSTMDITRYEGDYLKLLVFDGQHGSKEKNKVTLVKVQ